MFHIHLIKLKMNNLLIALINKTRFHIKTDFDYYLHFKNLFELFTHFVKKKTILKLLIFIFKEKENKYQSSKNEYKIKYENMFYNNSIRCISFKVV